MWDDLIDLASRLAKGEFSPLQALSEAERRLECVGKILNVVAVPMLDRAHMRSRQPFTGPFNGAPFLLKDSATAAIEGVRQPLGSAALKDDVPAARSHLVAGVEAAGLNAFAKTTTPEFSVLIDTYSAINGITRNPWDPTRSPGGSSGGSAAAVAARVVPAAHANDGAGSIRLPASFCGLVGLKPTRGRISLGPMIGESLGGTACEGVVSISVRDTAALLDSLAGSRPGDPYSAAPLPEPLVQSMQQPLRRLRIALVTESPFGGDILEEARDAAAKAALLCEALGHEIVETRLPIESGELKPRYKRFYPTNCNRTINSLLQSGERSEILSSLDAFQHHFWEEYSELPALDLVEVLSYFNRLTRNVARWMDEAAYDLWLSPTTACAAPQIGFFDAAVHGGNVVFERFLQVNPFTPIANLTGAPAISVPLHWTAANLPIGAHFVGRHGDEGLLLSLARQLELTQPWSLRLPPISSQNG